MPRLTPHNLIQDRLAGRLHNRKHESIVLADRAAEGVANDAAALWNELWRVLRTDHGYYANYQRARAVLLRLGPLLTDSIGRQLNRTADWGHKSAVGVYTQTLPVPYLVWAAARRRRRPVMEEDEEPGAFLFKWAQDRFSVKNLLAKLTGDDLTADERKDYLQELIFPAPSRDSVFRLLTEPAPDGRNWMDRIKTIVGGYQPDYLASVLAKGVSDGESLREIAIRVQPIVGGVRYKAMRIARTEGLRVAEAMNMRTTSQLGDLHAGYQIRATLDQRTRPKHAARNGLIWYRDGGQDMKRALRMEDDHLPDSPNCRCFLSTILTEPNIRTPAQRNALAVLSRSPVPDPQVITDWYANQPESVRRQAVTPKRFNVMRDRLGRDPHWAEVIDPGTGDLLPIAVLQDETQAATIARRFEVERLIAQRKDLLAEVGRFGFVRTPG